ncbi:hypothetical protein VNO77_14530 [Canavalia gladiata]|uniref:Uncharacterized protein n=1 Tax=Canavalia gladiata TaxID=3824 RepID=A0AAN9LY94_CANGL
MESITKVVGKVAKRRITGRDSSSSYSTLIVRNLTTRKAALPDHQVAYPNQGVKGSLREAGAIEGTMARTRPLQSSCTPMQFTRVILRSNLGPMISKKRRIKWLMPPSVSLMNCLRTPDATFWPLSHYSNFF